ncbi:MAG: histidine kinase dimerization/phosphoacceptor domain -containing protein [Bacteroidota bacterium]
MKCFQYLLILMCCCQSWYAIAQHPAANRISLDSLLNWLQPNLQNPNINTIAFEYAHIALQRAQLQTDSTKVAEAYLYLAEWHNFHADYFNRQNDSAIYYDHRALDVYDALDDKASVAMMYYYLGLDLHGIGRSSEAEAATLRSIEMYDSLGNREMIAKNYIQLCNLYPYYGDTLRSIEYGEKGIEELAKLGIDDRNAHAHTFLALAYQYGGQYEEAVQAATTSMEIFRETKGEERYWNPQYIQNYNIRGNAYLELKSYNKALTDFKYSLMISEQYDLGEQYGDYLLVATALTELERFEEALASIAAAERYQIEHEFDDPSAYKAYAETYEAMGDYKQALAYEKRAETYEIEDLKERIASMESELIVKYETAEKNKLIDLQSSQLQQQKRIQQLSFGIGGLLILLLGGLFLTYRSNQKRNRQLQELNNDLEDTNTQLDQRNAQNELLLKEIHHRVKNNLETVSSLLELQSAQVEDDEVQSVMQASQSRVQSMSILHQKLYQRENLASIEMKDYFKNLAESVLDTYDAWEKMNIEYDMSEMELDVDTAVPIGLIVNELLTNALKYAFPDGEKGKVYLSLKQVQPKGLQLLVADNGIGRSANTPSQGTGFGSQLVALLTRQLCGTMREERDNGIRYVFDFEQSIWN